ncbi:glycosyltransferase family 2 protein [uncultured Algibacter sp.]|uniref:glycosyltransferase family 2 protein n=1 Tax=uncultured Algibacter sp. TaxID=298659 RepID=UPI0026069FA0|nr:glycosyltransferase family 2 protein [uncultured Algibacter sp.]
MNISVIIPFYNDYETIGETLESLAQQSHSVYEVIIVDDFSNNEKEVENAISDYKSILPLRLLRNNQNKNGAYSRNRGIMNSRGDIIAFLDADDTWMPNKTQRMIQFVNKYGLERLFFSKVNIDVNGLSNFSRPKGFNSKVHISEYLFLEDGFIQTSSIFCGSNIAKEVLFQEHFKRHQDYDFVLRAYHKGVKFQFIPEELVTYKSALKVNLSKGESYEYSRSWANEMKVYFSDSGFSGFQIFNLTSRLLAEKRYGKAVINLFHGLVNLRINDYSRIYPKLKRTIKGVLK